MVTPWISSRNGEKERKRGGGGGDAGKREKEATDWKSLLSLLISLSLSLEFEPSIYISSTLPPLPPLLYLVLFLILRPLLPPLFFFVYISLILNQARAIRAKAFAGSCGSLTLCFSTLANAEIYTLQFRIVGISRPWYGFWKSRFGKAESSYLLRDLCSPLFDNSPSFQNI